MSNVLLFPTIDEKPVQLSMELGQTSDQQELPFQGDPGDEDDSKDKKGGDPNPRSQH